MKGFTLGEVLFVVAIACISFVVLWPILEKFNATDWPNAGDNASCIGGVLYHKGTAVVLKGNTIKC